MASSDDHAPKRIKLSLQPVTVPLPLDITDNGQEIYKNELSISERLTANVDRIWTEHFDLKYLTKDTLSKRRRAQEPKEEENHNTPADASSAPTGVAQPQLQQQQQQQQQQQAASMAPSLHPGAEIAQLRKSVADRLGSAKAEIDVALDVINILLSQPRSSVALVIPPGTMQSTYVTKPKQSIKSQLENAKLTLGSKRNQLSKASTFLLSSARNLSRLVDTEHEFWEEALDMRMNNWMLQARSTGTAAGGVVPGSVGRDTSGRAFHVQYGFVDVGSRFQDPSTAEIIRTYSSSSKKDTAQDIQLALPHNVRRRLRTRVVRIEMAGIVGLEGGVGGVVAGIDRGREAGSDMLLDDNASDAGVGTGEMDDFMVLSASEYGSAAGIQQQLADAQWTIFDAELFHEILREARATPGIRMIENQVVIPIDERHELIIEYLDADDTDSPPTTAASPASQTVNLALHLLLSRQHRYTLHRRERLLSSIGSGPNASAASASVPRAVGARSGAVGPAGPVSGSTQASAHAASAAQQMMQPTGILGPTLSWLKFWAMCERVRGIVEALIRPMCGIGGMEMRVHFEKLNGGMRGFDVGKGGDGARVGGASWAGVSGEVGMVVVVGVVKGPTLRFTLRNPTTILAHLPQTTLTLTSLTEFKDLITREINLMSLRIVCDEANDVLRNRWRNQRRDGKGAVEEDKWIWKVDEVEERSLGLVLWKVTKEKSVWRKVFVTPRRVPNDPSALYAFRLHIPPDTANGLNSVDSLVAMLTYTDEPKTSQQKKKDVTEIPTGAVGFRERVRGMTLRLLELCDSSSGTAADGK